MAAAAVVDICATIITNDDRFCSNFGIEMRRRWPIVNLCTLSVLLNIESDLPKQLKLILLMLFYIVRYAICKCNVRIVLVD